MKYIGGSVKLDGADVPIWDDNEMIPFRFREVSVVPQYAMSAMNPLGRSGRWFPNSPSRGAPFPRYQGRVGPPHRSRRARSRRSQALPDRAFRRHEAARVMVISTLLDPSLLIADEITSALDVSTQRAVAETLVSFRDHGFVKSMMVITHDISILYQIADSILIMYAASSPRRPRPARSSRSRCIHTHRCSFRRCRKSGFAIATRSWRAFPAARRRYLTPNWMPIPSPLSVGLLQVRGGTVVRGSRYRSLGRVLEGSGADA